MFGRPSILDHYRNLQEKVRGEILRESEEQIIGTDAIELMYYYLDKYSLSPIVIDENNEPSVDIQDYLKTIPAGRRDSYHREMGDLHDFPSQRAVIEVSILPNKDPSSRRRTISMAFSKRIELTDN